MSRHERKPIVHSYRTRHRDRSHEEAHRQADLQSLPPIVTHPLVPDGPAVMVETDAALSELAAHVRQEGRFAYDSEFITERSYLPKLCVVQVATARQVFVVDPLARLDLAPFWQLIADPAIEKIVHAGEQDLEPAVRHTGLAPANVFDVQVAAGLAGNIYPLSLARLVMEFMGAELPKGFTFTHWDHRPLSPSHVRYAADDVRYLPAIAAVLHGRLQELGHEAWAQDEMAQLCEPGRYRFDPQTRHLSVKYADTLRPRQLAVLRELVAVRDQAARRENLPPRTLLKDEVLIFMARHPVRTLADLAGVRGLPRPVEHAYGQQLVDATAAAMAMPLTDLPPVRRRERPAEDRHRVDELAAEVARHCAAASVSPALAATKQELTRFYRLGLLGREDEGSRLARGWRTQLLGSRLAQFLAQEKRL